MSHQIPPASPGRHVLWQIMSMPCSAIQREVRRRGHRSAVGELVECSITPQLLGHWYAVGALVGCNNQPPAARVRWFPRVIQRKTDSNPGSHQGFAIRTKNEHTGQSSGDKANATRGGTGACGAHVDLKRSNVGRPSLRVALGVAFVVGIAVEAHLGQVVLHVCTHVDLTDPTTGSAEQGKGRHQSVGLVFFSLVVLLPGGRGGV